MKKVLILTTLACVLCTEKIMAASSTTAQVTSATAVTAATEATKTIIEQLEKTAQNMENVVKQIADKTQELLKGTESPAMAGSTNLVNTLPANTTAAK